MVDQESSLYLSLLLALGCGVICGTINGSLSVAFQIPSFIVTLGMLEIARGAAYHVTDSRTKYIGSSLEWIGASGAWGVSPAFIFAVATVVVGQLVLSRTLLGRYWIAIGTNEKAASTPALILGPIDLRLLQRWVVCVGSERLCSVHVCRRLILIRQWGLSYQPSQLR